MDYMIICHRSAEDRGGEGRAAKKRSKGIPCQGWGDAGGGPGTLRALSIQVYDTRKQQKPGRRGGGLGVELDTVSQGWREEVWSEKGGGAESQHGGIDSHGKEKLGHGC